MGWICDCSIEKDCSGYVGGSSFTFVVDWPSYEEGRGNEVVCALGLAGVGLFPFFLESFRSKVLRKPGSSSVIPETSSSRRWRELEEVFVHEGEEPYRGAGGSAKRRRDCSAWDWVSSPEIEVR